MTGVRDPESVPRGNQAGTVTRVRRRVPESLSPRWTSVIVADQQRSDSDAAGPSQTSALITGLLPFFDKIVTDKRDHGL